MYAILWPLIGWKNQRIFDVKLSIEIIVFVHVFSLQIKWQCEIIEIEAQASLGHFRCNPDDLVKTKFDTDHTFGGIMSLRYRSDPCWLTFIVVHMIIAQRSEPNPRWRLRFQKRICGWLCCTATPSSARLPKIMHATQHCSDAELLLRASTRDTTAIQSQCARSEHDR